MPRAIRNARAREMQGKRAGFVTRLLAIAVDVGIVFVLYLTVLFGYAVLRFLVSSQPLKLPNPETWVRIAVICAVAFFYLVSAWSSTGRTIGAQVFGLAVVTDHGAPLSYGRAAARALICIAIGEWSLLWSLVSRKNAAIHDLICHTAVVYDWRGRALVDAHAADH